MIRIEKKLDIAPDFTFETLADREQLLFFDIETTGLSPAKAALYLIGTVTFEEGSWILRQFFAESLFEEEELLHGFFGILNRIRRRGRVFMVSYNGDGFDLPFLHNCIRQYHLPYAFTDTFSLDLLKAVRPYRTLLALQDCKLKTVERFLGILREDRYSGGELIYVYEEYLRLSAIEAGSLEDNPLQKKLRQKLLDTLLLHNAEDIQDMPLLLPVLGYDRLFAGEFTVTESAIVGHVWDIHARLLTPLPKGLYRETQEYTLSISEEDPLELNLTVPVCRGEFLYFFVDYKNYYYLPAEDYAIHKSVGEYVDKKARRQATARTCYQKKDGYFVPQPAAVFTPCFYREYKGTPYGLLQEAAGGMSAGSGSMPSAPDPKTAAKYILALLSQLKAQKTR